ncbi:MAG: TIGR02597 family protein [Chthoniobacterales bacterium]
MTRYFALSMNFLRTSFAAIATTALAASALQAQTTSTTDPVGFMTIATPTNNDTIIGAPLTKPPVFQGAVSSRSNFVITVSPSPGFGSLTATPHYVQPVTGSQAGVIFDVATNNSNSITLVDNGITPTGLDPSNSFKVIPYWTLGQIFPAADQNVSFTPSGTTGPSRRTQVLLPNITNTGINRSASAIFFFVTNSADPTNPAVSYWRAVGGGATNFDATPLLPDTYFTVRNPTNAATNLQVTVAGNVNTGAMVVPLDAVLGTANDNYVSLGRPTDITLDGLGLVSSGAFTVSTNTTGPARRDQLLVISNSVPGLNKSASVIYYYLSNPPSVGWRAVGGGTNDFGTNVIQAAIGYTIRKASNNPTGTSFWTNTITIAP